MTYTASDVIFNAFDMISNSLASLIHKFWPQAYCPAPEKRQRKTVFIFNFWRECGLLWSKVTPTHFLFLSFTFSSCRLIWSDKRQKDLTVHYNDCVSTDDL
jgi:hypothetical protein